MVKALLSIVAVVVTRRVPLLELGGAVAVVVGVSHLWGSGAGWLAAGVGLLAKSAELSGTVNGAG